MNHARGCTYVSDDSEDQFVEHAAARQIQFLERSLVDLRGRNVSDLLVLEVLEQLVEVAVVLTERLLVLHAQRPGKRRPVLRDPLLQLLLAALDLVDVAGLGGRGLTGHGNVLLLRADRLASGAGGQCRNLAEERLQTILADVLEWPVLVPLHACTPFGQGLGAESGRGEGGGGGSCGAVPPG